MDDGLPAKPNIIRTLWSKPDSYDIITDHFQLKGIEAEPKPVNGRPPILNAAGLELGRDFATRNADFLFTSVIDFDRSRAEIAELKAQAAAQGRNVDVLTFSHVVCRPTEAEAQDYLKPFAQDNADWEAVDNLVRLQFAHAQSFPHDLGLGGTTLSFVDYGAEFPYFRDNVLPILEARGIRQPG